MSDNYPLRRRQVVATLMPQNDEILVVAGLGSTAWDVTAAGDRASLTGYPQMRRRRALTFPLWGAMGGAVALGLGLALAQPTRRVLVITGDGELLMGLGSLATVAVQRPENLAIAVIDNERYGCGRKLTHNLNGMLGVVYGHGPECSVTGGFVYRTAAR